MCVRFDTIPGRDRQTDGQTCLNNITLWMHRHADRRLKKLNVVSVVCSSHGLVVEATDLHLINLGLIPAGTHTSHWWLHEGIQCISTRLTLVCTSEPLNKGVTDVIFRCRSQWSSGSIPDCSVRGPGIESRCGHWAVVFIAQPLRFTALGTGCVHLSCSA